jgi:hypothetical protein
LDPVSRGVHSVADVTINPLLNNREAKVRRKKNAQTALAEDMWRIASNFIVYDSVAEDNSNIRMVTDLDECQMLWQAVMPGEYITDLWEVRVCFQQHFRRPPNFIVVEDNHGISGLLPLSLIEELHCYGYFPGETWHGKTWLEQNRICFRNGGIHNLLACIQLPYHLRYLAANGNGQVSGTVVDEIGYLFSAQRYGYDIRNYFAEFSHKSIKQILRDIAALERGGVTYRYDDIADFDLMIQLNASRFGVESYFYDPRFRESFRSLAHYLHDQGWLRFTTVLIGGEPAAVDMGCLYGGVYTLLAGGTNADFPGVAKLINLHHMQRACNEHIPQVDFLCGDFNWKKLFHLTQRPLFLLSNLTADISEERHPMVTLHAVNYQ